MSDFNWYRELTQPALSPPSWVFSPVWGILYITIISSFLLFFAKQTLKSKTQGYLWFTIQLVLNLLWTPAFFILKNILLSLLIILLMNISVFMTIKHFYKISKLAAYLLIPYFIWIMFAAYLNLGLFILNK